MMRISTVSRPSTSILKDEKANLIEIVLIAVLAHILMMVISTGASTKTSIFDN